jgi:type II secretory pathway pseudopilin PulG
MNSMPGRAAKRGRRGMVLFEAIVALTILVVAALSMVAWVGQEVDTVARAGAAAATADSASDYLDRIALWTRADLDRHLGPRQAGSWTVTIERSTRVLYDVVIRDNTNARTILQTTLYRPESPE